MPLLATRGAASAQGFGEFAQTAVATYIEDVFSTYVYSGQSSGTITIDNGIDLSGEGGLVWIKQRNGTSGHQLCDTERGITNRLQTNTTGAQSSEAFLGSVTSTGFTLPANYGDVSGSTGTYTSWTFRKAKKFFDVVTYTGTGSTRSVSHSLDSIPGCIIIKCTSNADQWMVYHRSLGTSKFLYLNTTGSEQTFSWISSVGSTSFTLEGGSSLYNDSGRTYVAYLFAHDAGGFGDAGDQNVISCGSFAHNFSGATVNLGWEPQWVLVKAADQVNNWYIFDNMRGIATGGDDAALFPNLSDAENLNSWGIDLTATGFTVSGNNILSSGNAIYIAIRRGPMKTPEAGTEVFEPLAVTPSSDASRNITVTPDLLLYKYRSGTASFKEEDRLRGFANTNTGTSGKLLLTSSTAAESSDFPIAYTIQNKSWLDGAGLNGVSSIIYNFRRAPGFFDVVCYTGTGVTRTVNHNLGVAPELIIVKRRNTTASWAVYAAPLTASYAGFLDLNNAFQADNLWDSTAPTSTVFTVRSANIQVNASGSTYVAYLFASVSGVSKVGSYTGTGTTQQINCGFSSGARFVLIKRTDSTGDWYVWDSARGIVAGNDPYLLLNSTAAEVTNTDYVDTYSAGFEISSTAPAAINANGGTFIFLAIA